MGRKKATTQQVLEEVKKAGDVGILASDLSKILGITDNGVNIHLRTIMSWSPCPIMRERVGGEKSGYAYRYYYVGVPETEHKNSEGYPDATAGKAIDKVDNERAIESGYMYGRRYSDNDSLFFVVGKTATNFLGYLVFIADSKDCSEESVVWEKDGVRYMVDYNWITSTSLTSLTPKCRFEVPNWAKTEIFTRCPIIDMDKDLKAKYDRLESAYNQKVQTLVNFHHNVCEALCVDKNFTVADLIAVVRENKIVADSLHEANTTLKTKLDESVVKIEELTNDLDEQVKIEKDLRRALLESESKLKVDDADRLLDLQRADFYEKVYKDLIDVLSARTKVSMTSNGLAIKQ